MYTVAMEINKYVIIILFRVKVVVKIKIKNNDIIKPLAIILIALLIYPYRYLCDIVLSIGINFKDIHEYINLKLKSSLNTIWLI